MRPHRLTLPSSAMLPEHEQPSSDFAGWEGRIDYQDRPRSGPVLSSIQGPGLKLRYEVDQQGRITRVDCNDAVRLRYEYDGLGRLVRFTRSPIDR